MMHRRLDARGLTCPSPVLLVKEAVESGEAQTIAILVDNESARENVSRFLQSRGFIVSSAVDGKDFVINGSGAAGATGVGPAVEPGPVAPAQSARKIMVVVAGTALGRGDDLLGEKLLVNYLKTLREMGPDLWRLVFINGGVKLTVAASPVLAELRAYEQGGLIILACGTCLEHFGLTAEKQVGQTTNMLDIVTAMQLADSVVTLG